jgi:hypothetical protein
MGVTMLKAPRLPLLAVALLVGVGGWDGGGPPGTAASPDAGRAPAPAAQPAGDAAPASDTGNAGAPDLAPAAAPVSGTTKRLVAGAAHLVGMHLTACSHPASASVDRWCAFTIAGQAGKTELWVIDAIKALSGSVACDGSDPACLRMTPDLWTGITLQGPSHPTAHRFDGETLIFHAGAPNDLDEYRGPIFAWRPGWPTAHQISGPTGYTCVAHERAEAAFCLEALSDPADPVFSFELHGGPLAIAPLPLLSKVFPLHPDTGASQWAVAFSPAGDYLAYSTGGATTAEREALTVVQTVDAAYPDRRVKVSAGLSRWTISPDAKKWYFLRDFDYGTAGTSPAGTLAMADFPAGGHEVALAPQVVAMEVLDDGSGADRGVAFYDSVTTGETAAFKVMRDPGQKEVVTVSAGVVAAASLSPDLRYAVVATSSNFDGTTDAHLVRTDGSGVCTLVETPTIDFYGQAFLPHAGLVLWTDAIDFGVGVGQGWLAHPEGCGGKRKFADGVDFWFPAHDDGLIYSDGGQAMTADLRYVKLGPGAVWPAGPSPIIRRGVGRVFAVLEPDRDYVVFEVASGGPDDGLYVHGPLGLAP